MNCLIIDDNPKTAAALTQLLGACTGVSLVQQAVQPYQVNAILAGENIGLVFVRVRLWRFEQFRQLKAMPIIVFLTGGRDKLTNQPETTVPYSLREPYTAFELKRLLYRVESERITEAPDYFFVRYDGRFHKVLFKDIEMFERKEGSYVQLVLTHNIWLIPGNLVTWIRQLPEGEFIRGADSLILPAAEWSKVKNKEYNYKGRIIKLTFRFAAKARTKLKRQFADMD